MCELQSLFRALDEQETDAGRIMVLGLIADAADDIGHQDAVALRRLYDAKWLPKITHGFCHTSVYHQPGLIGIGDACGLDPYAKSRVMSRYWHDDKGFLHRTIRGLLRHVLKALRGEV